jgi:hypothetical protein
MSESADFRTWAARVASQAAKERDESEVLRLMSIAEYWKRLADIDDPTSGLPRLGKGSTAKTPPVGDGVF